MIRVVPLLHPAAIQRGRFTDEPPQITYLKRWVARAKREPAYQPPDVSEPPPNTKFYAGASHIRSLHNELRSFTEPVASIDLESAGIYLICIGLTALDLTTATVGSTINVPIRLRGGRQANAPNSLEEIVIAFADLLEDPTIAKLFHNGIAFDIPELEELGFTVAGDVHDSLVLSHHLYPEFKKGLQYRATLHCGAPVWKDLLEEEDEIEGKS